jgi:hypothetical protein
MLHLARLMTSTNSQVCFISETRSSTITRTSLINRFNVSDAFVVPALGQSGGLWLIWKDAVSLTVIDHSPNFIFAMCNNNIGNRHFLLVYLYGDPHHQNTTTIWMQVLNFVENNNGLPILCTGDMNDIMHPNEKSDPGRPNLRRINAFCDYVKQCGFIDLGYSGPAYTWTNKRRNTMPTFERLDRSLANAEWCTAYPNTTVYHLPMLRSDHAPILTLLNSSRRHTNKPFRFENWWLLEQGYEEVAKSSWQRSTRRPFHQKK